MMDYALTVYPLSNGYRRRFEETVGVEPCYLSVGELRRLPLVHLFRALRGIRGRLFLPMEDSNAKSLLPVLQALAAASRSRSIEVIGPELLQERVSRRQALLSLGSLIEATLVGRFALHRSGRDLADLLGVPRIVVPPLQPGRLVYLKTNLWLGVKAGGSIGHIAGVVNGFVDRGWGVDFLAAEPPVMLREAVGFHPIQAPRTYGLPSEVNLYTFHDDFLQQAQRLLDGRETAFIYQRMSVGNYVGVRLSRALNLPLVIEYNGSEVWISRHWGTPLRFERIAEQAELICLRHAHLIVTISDVLRDELIGRGVEPERIVMYPNCIDPLVFDPENHSAIQSRELRARHGIAEDALLATFVGTFGQWHGAEILARVIRNLALNDPGWLRERRLHFMLVGDGQKMSSVREILGDERCKPFYTLTGLVPQAETSAYLAASDIFLSPHVANADGSRFFGSPTKLFEYMAMGRAIIASDLDQIGEVLHGSPHVSRSEGFAELPANGQCAVMTRPGDGSEIEMALRFLAERPVWRAGLGENARRRALEKYTWDSHVGAILEGLANVLETVRP